MTSEHFQAILKTVQVKDDKDGWTTLIDGTLTLYLAHSGVNLTLARIEALRTEGELIYARTPKRELFALARDDIFAVAFDGASVSGQPGPRRAGFL